MANKSREQIAEQILGKDKWDVSHLPGAGDVFSHEHPYPTNNMLFFRSVENEPDWNDWAQVNNYIKKDGYGEIDGNSNEKLEIVKDLRFVDDFEYPEASYVFPKNYLPADFFQVESLICHCQLKWDWFMPVPPAKNDHDDYDEYDEYKIADCFEPRNPNVRLMGLGFNDFERNYEMSYCIGEKFKQDIYLKIEFEEYLWFDPDCPPKPWVVRLYVVSSPEVVHNCLLKRVFVDHGLITNYKIEVEEESTEESEDSLTRILDFKTLNEEDAGGTFEDTYSLYDEDGNKLTEVITLDLDDEAKMRSPHNISGVVGNKIQISNPKGDSTTVRIVDLRSNWDVVIERMMEDEEEEDTEGENGPFYSISPGDFYSFEKTWLINDVLLGSGLLNPDMTTTHNIFTWEGPVLGRYIFDKCGRELNVDNSTGFHEQFAGNAGEWLWDDFTEGTKRYRQIALDPMLRDDEKIEFGKYDEEYHEDQEGTGVEALDGGNTKPYIIYEERGGLYDFSGYYSQIDMPNNYVRIDIGTGIAHNFAQGCLKGSILQTKNGYAYRIIGNPAEGVIDVLKKTVGKINSDSFDDFGEEGEEGGDGGISGEEAPEFDPRETTVIRIINQKWWMINEHYDGVGPCTDRVSDIKKDYEIKADRKHWSSLNENEPDNGEGMSRKKGTIEKNGENEDNGGEEGTGENNGNGENNEEEDEEKSEFGWSKSEGLFRGYIDGLVVGENYDYYGQTVPMLVLRTNGDKCGAWRKNHDPNEQFPADREESPWKEDLPLFYSESNNFINRFREDVSLDDGYGSGSGGNNNGAEEEGEEDENGTILDGMVKLYKKFDGWCLTTVGEDRWSNAGVLSYPISSIDFGEKMGDEYDEYDEEDEGDEAEEGYSGYGEDDIGWVDYPKALFPYDITVSIKGTIASPQMIENIMSSSGAYITFGPVIPTLCWSPENILFFLDQRCAGLEPDYDYDEGDYVDEDVEQDEGLDSLNLSFPLDPLDFKLESKSTEEGEATEVSEKSLWGIFSSKFKDIIGQKKEKDIFVLNTGEDNGGDNGEEDEDLKDEYYGYAYAYGGDAGGEGGYCPHCVDVGYTSAILFDGGFVSNHYFSNLTDQEICHLSGIGFGIDECGLVKTGYLEVNDNTAYVEDKLHMNITTITSYDSLTNFGGLSSLYDVTNEINWVVYYDVNSKKLTLRAGSLHFHEHPERSEIWVGPYLYGPCAPDILCLCDDDCEKEVPYKGTCYICDIEWPDFRMEKFFHYIICDFYKDEPDSFYLSRPFMYMAGRYSPVGFPVLGQGDVDLQAGRFGNEEYSGINSLGTGDLLQELLDLLGEEHPIVGAIIDAFRPDKPEDTGGGGKTNEEIIEDVKGFLEGAGYVDHNGLPVSPIYRYPRSYLDKFRERRVSLGIPAFNEDGSGNTGIGLPGFESCPHPSKGKVLTTHDAFVEDGARAFLDVFRISDGSMVLLYTKYIPEFHTYKYFPHTTHIDDDKLSLENSPDKDNVWPCKKAVMMVRTTNLGDRWVGPYTNLGSGGEKGVPRPLMILNGVDYMCAEYDRVNERLLIFVKCYKPVSEISSSISSLDDLLSSSIDEDECKDQLIPYIGCFSMNLLRTPHKYFNCVPLNDIEDDIKDAQGDRINMIY